ncbi:hypothetical protein SELMODRAFT_431271 [Selaginella moellendorffii]|uniref:Class II aldolase/adducin N-terminal domain-containing protein n=1 Tax=Selaginella moellendorffii TaxID=88036 RepID=D8TC30_SELML|nr:hypothetical protein SELMODRAFT_431271 [Selaginella moellendorffii]
MNPKLPIIENSAYEYEVTNSIAAASAAYPRTTAALLRNHGIYVWGDSWFCAKTKKAECYHYLFDAALKLRQFGLDHTDPLHGPVKKLSLAVPRKNYPARNAVYLCGLLSNVFLVCTTIPVSFVMDVCFPVHMTMRENTSQPLTIRRRLKALKDTKEGNVQTQFIPPSDAPKDEVRADIFGEQDTKTVNTKAKSFRTFLKHSPCAESKAYIYSSGSQEAQRLIFGNTNFGLLRYCRITSPRAVAAKEAGLDTVILERPGNAPLPSGQQAPFGTLMILKVCKLLLKQRIAPWHIRAT